MHTMPDVDWSRLAAFVRKHGHDLCNELNGLDLQATLAAELVTDAEARAGLKQLRAGLRQIATDLRALSAKVAEPKATLAPTAAGALFKWWEQQLANTDTRLEVEWTCTLGDERINVDASAVEWAFQELLENAAAFPASGKLRASAYVAEASVIFELREPKAARIDPARWGRAPFESLRSGHYGLGLCAVVRAITASGGTIAWTCTDLPCELITTIRFPVAA